MINKLKEIKPPVYFIIYVKVTDEVNMKSKIRSSYVIKEIIDEDPYMFIEHLNETHDQYHPLGVEFRKEYEYEKFILIHAQQISRRKIKEYNEYINQIGAAHSWKVEYPNYSSGSYVVN